jgi:simple sugar transport system ATP-binding protein
MMVGRSVLLRVDKDPAQPAEPVLEVSGLMVNDERNLPAVRGLDLTVRAGEIVGVAGVQGNGQTELVEAITGLRSVLGGRVLINGKDLTDATPRNVTQAGVSHVPEDRQKNGMVMTFPITDNIRLQQYYHEPFSNGLLADDNAINRASQELVKRFDVRTPGIFTPIGSLSGGNQQKVIIARELSRNSKLVIVAQPTRGLDVGSIEFIHKQIVAMRDSGSAVLLVSTELDEILSLSDRIVVMYAGQINTDIPAANASRELIGLRMAGVLEDAKAEASHD